MPETTKSTNANPEVDDFIDSAANAIGKALGLDTGSLAGLFRSGVAIARDLGKDADKAAKLRGEARERRARIEEIERERYRYSLERLNDLAVVFESRLNETFRRSATSMANAAANAIMSGADERKVESLLIAFLAERAPAEHSFLYALTSLDARKDLDS
jgi:hypothetical protein